MAYVIGCLMAGLSFLLNKLLLRYIGNQVVISYSPIVEEMTKTLCSYYLSADILVTHIVFGVLEAGYDWFNQQNEYRGMMAAFFSIIGHTLFGGITVLVFFLTHSIYIGIVVASVVHVVWNVTFIRLSN